MSCADLRSQPSCKWHRCSGRILDGGHGCWLTPGSTWTIIQTAVKVPAACWPEKPAQQGASLLLSHAITFKIYSEHCRRASETQQLLHVNHTPGTPLASVHHHRHTATAGLLCPMSNVHVETFKLSSTLHQSVTWPPTLPRWSVSQPYTGSMCRLSHPALYQRPPTATFSRSSLSRLTCLFVTDNFHVYSRHT